MNRFADHTFVISGGARGMGAAQARKIVAQGGSVLIADILREKGRALADELGPAARFQPLDVTDEAQWAQAVSEARQLGPLRGLVNNAGVFLPASLPDTELALFERHMQVNQLGTFLGMKVVSEALKVQGGGSIVNISSTAGLRGVPQAIAYTGTKWAVRGMTKSAARELGPFDIRVNSVHPGLIDTEMLHVRDRAENLAQAQAQPIKRLGTAEEVADLVLFLLSDESRFMTGAELTIDGGRSL